MLYLAFVGKKKLKFSVNILEIEFNYLICLFSLRDRSADKV